MQTGLAVLWTVLNFDNCIVGHCFLGLKVFHIIFLKLFELHFRAIWANLSGLSNFFPNSLPLTCIQAKTAQRAPQKWDIWRIPSHFLPILHYLSSASKSARFSCCLWLVSPADELYPEGEVRHGRYLGRNESNGKGAKGSQMLGIDE